MWIINDHRDFQDMKEKLFVNAQSVATFKTWTLKKVITTLSVFYGLFEEDKLISYYWLMAIRHRPNTYKGHEFHVADDYQGQGIGSFLYDFILHIEHLTVVSDHFHTSGSSLMWDKLRTLSNIKVGTYNEITDTIDYDSPVDKDAIYGNDFMHFIVRAK